VSPSERARKAAEAVNTWSEVIWAAPLTPTGIGELATLIDEAAGLSELEREVKRAETSHDEVNKMCDALRQRLDAVVKILEGHDNLAAHSGVNECKCRVCSANRAARGEEGGE